MADQAPDILLVMTDQQRADFSRGAGFALDTMPFMDSLAARGTRFTDAYTTAPACVPARTSLLTGRFPSAHRVRQNSTGKHALYDTDLLDVLRSAGYRLHFAGKPHMYRDHSDFDDFRGPYMHRYGPECPGRPQEGRFDEWLDEIDNAVWPEATRFPSEVQHPYRIVSDALDALPSAPRDAPLFLWVSFPEPHNPYQAPEPYFSMFPESEIPDRSTGPDACDVKGGDYVWLRDLIAAKRPGYDANWRRYRANYCAMLRLIDDQIRRLFEGLSRRAGRETVVIFVSDHGDYAGEYGLQRKGAGMPECLMRIPMVFSGTGIAVQRRDELVSIADIMPTVAELVTGGLPAGVQGRSLLPLLSGGGRDVPEFASIYGESGFGGLPYGADERPPLHFDYSGPTFDELNTVTQSGQLKMVRQGGYKLLMDVDGRAELYDLGSDPHELVNLYESSAHTEQRETLTRELLRWTLRLTDVLPRGRYTPKLPPHNWYTASEDIPSATGSTIPSSATSITETTTSGPSRPAHPIHLGVSKPHEV